MTEAEKLAICSVCDLRVREIEKITTKGIKYPVWIHDDPAYDNWKSPIHSAQPKEDK